MPARARTLAIAVSLAAAPAVAHAAVTISTAPTQNMSCSNGVCTPTAKNAVLNVADLTAMLASSNVRVNTGSGSLASKVKDIVVSASFNWASAHSLTLDAWRSVTFDKPVAVNGTGAVSLTTNDGGTGGTLSFGTKGSLSFLGTSNALTINGSVYTLENSIASLAAAVAANANGNYALANNYNASVDGTYPGSPVPTAIAGNVQGLGNAISNLSIDFDVRSTSIGLFAEVAAGASISNMRLTSESIRFTSLDVGDVVGGLAGNNLGLLAGDTVSGTIKLGKSSSAGGLVGSNYGTGTIISSSTSVGVSVSTNTTTRQEAGGLAAENFGLITLSHASGPVSGSEAGGLVSNNEGNITESFATGAVAAKDGSLVGGLAGINQQSIGISNCYALGAVMADTSSTVGGLAGTNSNTSISYSYATGKVSGGSGAQVGGFVGADDSDQYTDDYWDTSTSMTNQGTGGGNVPGITGLTTTQLQSGLPAGFDPTIWAENPNINGGFPYLINNPPR